MPEASSRIRLALDVNFPEPILRALSEFLPDAELVPLRHLDPRLTELDDRHLMLALRQESIGWLVTNNYRMLRNPSELAAIMKAQINVFAIEGVGDDPLRATGALLLDLPGALRRAATSRAEIFWSRPRNPQPVAPWDLFTKAAEHRHEDPHELYESVKITDTEMAMPWHSSQE